MLWSTYPGGKRSCWRPIVNVMPPHSVYVEPFIGAGGVLRNKRPAAVNIGIDRDPDVVRTWVRYMRAVWDYDAGRLRDDAPADLVRQFPALRDAPDGCQFIFLCGDALAWLAEAGADLDRRALVYCDPPYLPSTRGDRKHYRYELFADDHAVLLDLLLGLRARVVLSGYASAVYDRALAGWSYTDFPAVTRAGASTESLWFNYAPPAVLHDYSQLGADHREREKLRRRARRWAGGLLRMPPLERQALLSALVDALGPEAVAAIAAAGLDAVGAPAPRQVAGLLPDPVSVDLAASPAYVSSQ